MRHAHINLFENARNAFHKNGWHAKVLPENAYMAYNQLSINGNFSLTWEKNAGYTIENRTSDCRANTIGLIFTLKVKLGVDLKLFTQKKKT